jgi:hypothetical protein
MTIFGELQANSIFILIYLLSAILVFQAGEYLRRFYSEFFIGESPKGWYILSRGLKALSLALLLDITLLVFGLKQNLLLNIIRFFPSVLIFIGGFKIVRRI